MRSWPVRLLLVCAIVLGAFGLIPSAVADSPVVVRLDLDGAVEPFSASYVVDGIHGAEDARAKAVLLRIDTPGGLDSSMRKIVGAVLDAKIPVVCWVGPEGARAASAGTFVLLACDVATMAPGTNLGAAHPVGFRGEVLDEKITNDASAFIRSIAQERGRNAAWAERAVRESVSASAREALDLHVIDALARTPIDALKVAKIDHVSVVKRSMPFGRGFLGSLVDPNLAFLLLLLGLAGLVFEVLHPGISVPGVGGFFCLVVALVMLEMLPVSIGGVALIVGGIVLLVVELHVPGFGLPGVAGVAGLLAGGLLLFDAGSLVRVSRPVIVGAVVAKALLILVVGRKVLAARRMPPPLPSSLVGESGVATTPIDPIGTVRVRSELWTAETSDAPIDAGASVLVTGEEGLRLRVKKGQGGPPG